MVTTRMLMRSPRRTALVVAAVGLVVLALPLAWYLASPLFLTQAVSESAPAAPAQSRLAAGTFRRRRRHSQGRRRGDAGAAA